MSNVDDASAAPTSDDEGVGDIALRAQRAAQKKLDEAWKKYRAMLNRHEPLTRLTDPQREDIPCVGHSGSVALVKRWRTCKGCNEPLGVHPTRAVNHVLDCQNLAEAARNASAIGDNAMKQALLDLCSKDFKKDGKRSRADEVRAFLSPSEKTNVSDAGVEVTVVESATTKGTATNGIKQYLRELPSNREITKINEAVSELIVDSAIPFNWTSSPAFYKFMHALRPDLFTETEKTQIKSGVLDKQPKNIRGRVWHASSGLDSLFEKRMLAVQKEVEQSEELAFAADGWQSEDGRKVLNLAITVRETGREYYWKSVELGTETESASFMQRAVTQVMIGLPLKKFKCIIGDNTSHVIKFLEAIASTPETSHVTPIGCFAHRFNLLAGDVVETFKTFFVDLERAINKLHVKPQMRALFDAARKEKNVTKQLETYCQTRWASAHACLHSYVANIDVLRFLNEDEGKIAKDFRKLCTPDLESTFNVLFSSVSQMAVRQLEPLFSGLASANKFVEGTRANLAEVFPLCWALEKDLSQWLANVKMSAHQSWIARATIGDGSTCTTPEQLSIVLKRVYDVRFEGLEAQQGKANTKRKPLRDDPLVHFASSLSYMLHKNMRIKHKAPVADTFMSKEAFRMIRFHAEDGNVPDVEAADLALENLNATAIPKTAKKFQERYADLFTNDAYVEACTDRTFVDVTLEQLQYIRQHNWRRNFLEQEDVQNWPEWKHLIPCARRMNAIVPHSASVERMNSAQKLVHNSKRLSLRHARVEKLTFVYFNNKHKRRAVGSIDRLVSEVSKVTENEVEASPVVDVAADDADDADADGADEILSSDDDGLDEYLKDADELVMSPLANVSNRTEMTCVGNLDRNMQVQDDDSHPARDKEKETFAQKAARKALERQEKQKRRKHRRLNQ